jgi:hypothetical protein
MTAARQLGICHDELDFRVLIEQRGCIARVTGVECVEAQLVQDIGRHHSDKGLVFND